MRVTAIAVITKQLKNVVRIATTERVTVSRILLGGGLVVSSELLTLLLVANTPSVQLGKSILKESFPLDIRGAEEYCIHQNFFSEEDK